MKILCKKDPSYLVEHLLAEHYHWTHEDIMKLTDSELAYYVATYLVHDILPQKKSIQSNKYKRLGKSRHA